MRAWTPEPVRAAGFDAYLSRLWFDTHLHSDVALAGLIDRVGTDRLVFGTNFAGWDADDPGSRPDAKGADLAGNARRLLRL
jgi:aminocarboxymuconate-semialdehyde decarboxylase